MPEPGGGPGELQMIRGDIEMRGLDGEIEGDDFVEPEAAPLAQEAVGGQVPAHQLGDDRVLRLPDAEGERVAAVIDRRDVDQVVGQHRGYTTVVAGAGGAR